MSEQGATMAGELSSVSNCRDWLAQTLCAWLQWRAAQAKEHPDDRLDLGSAEALMAAARDIAALPDDDRKLGRIVCLRKAGDDAVDRFLEEANVIVAHHALAPDGTKTTADLLAALIEATDDAVMLSLDDSPSPRSGRWPQQPRALPDPLLPDLDDEPCSHRSFGARLADH